MDAQALADLDAKGVDVLDAIAHVTGPMQGSLATPHAFVTSTGKTMWVKSLAQHGLANELIAGRLAGRVGAGPAGAVVNVHPQALPADGSADHLSGLCSATEDVNGAVNVRELNQIGVTTLDPKTIDAAQRALVVTFQTWIGLGDLQAIIDFGTGRVLSHDHGDCFANPTSKADPQLAVLSLPGVPDSHGSDAGLVADAVAKVESLSDDDLLNAVARMPSEPQWHADPAKRLQIAEWLAQRRDKIAEVMKTW